MNVLKYFFCVLLGAWLCLIGMSVAKAYHANQPVTPPVHVTLADAMWSDHVSNKAKACAVAAFKEGKSSVQMDHYFNKCLFEAGVTI